MEPLRRSKRDYFSAFEEQTSSNALTHLKELGWIGNEHEAEKFVRALNDFLIRYIPAGFIVASNPPKDGMLVDVIETIKVIQSLPVPQRVELKKTVEVSIEDEIKKTGSALLYECYATIFGIMNEACKDQSVLIHLIVNHQFQILGRLIHYGADLGFLDRSFYLHQAVLDGHKITTIAILILCGANLNLLNSHKETPLHCSLYKNPDLETNHEAHLLISSGARTDIPDDNGLRAEDLILAWKAFRDEFNWIGDPSKFRSRYHEIVGLLRVLALKFLFIDHLVYKGNSIDLVPTMRKFRAMDDQNRYAWFARFSGTFKHHLIYHNSTLNQKNFLNLALIFGPRYSFPHPGKGWWNPNPQEPVNRFTPLQFLISIGPNECFDRFITEFNIDLLKEYESGILGDIVPRLADINIPNEKGETPLHLAVCNGSEEWIKFLIARGANPNIRDNEGNTPLRLAVRNSANVRILEILLSEGAEDLPDLNNEKALTLAMDNLDYDKEVQIMENYLLLKRID